MAESLLDLGGKERRMLAAPGGGKDELTLLYLERWRRANLF